MKAGGLPKRKHYSLWYHFTGKAKPWLNKPPVGEVNLSALGLWYELLREVSSQYSLGINVETLSEDKLPPPLGFFSTAKDIGGMKKQKKKEKTR